MQRRRSNISLNRLRLPALAARALGWHPAPVPLNMNSRPYGGRPACVDCGFCGGYGCPINAKGTGGPLLHDALRTGRCELRAECFVFEVTTDRAGVRATGVSYLDRRGKRRHQAARAVVLALRGRLVARNAAPPAARPTTTPEA